MRRVCSVLLVLILLFSAGLAEDLSGTWRFTGGGELLGYGFTLRPDGTGNFLESEDWAVFPQRHLHETQDAPFAWQVTQGENGELNLELTFGDGRAAVYLITLEGDKLSVTEDDPEFLGGGGYERYDEAALAAWVDTAASSPLTDALREYLHDEIETRLPGLGLRSPEIWARPAGNDYTLEFHAVVSDIVWNVDVTMTAAETRVTWSPLNPSSAAPEAEGGFAVWGADVPLQGALQSAVDCARQEVAEAEQGGALPEVPRLIGQEERWKPNKYYPVYQGPGKSYGRSAGGKGKVSTNDVITTYGTWQGWLLISYGISENHHRFGWISEADVGAGAFSRYEELPFLKDNVFADYRVGVLTEEYPLTDDPGRTNSPVATLSAGSSIHCLGLYDVWMLVEGFSGGKLAMGFVHAELVDREHGYVLGAERGIGQPVTYTEKEINAAMDVVEQAIYVDWPGTHLLNMQYDEVRSNEEADWYADEGMQCMILYCDLNDIALYDYEIGGEMTGDYEFVVRRVPDGEWELCNWGYR